MATFSIFSLLLILIYISSYLPLQSIGIAELKAQLAEQERTIKMLVQSRGHGQGQGHEVEMGEMSGLLQDKTRSSTGSFYFIFIESSL